MKHLLRLCAVIFLPLALGQPLRAQSDFRPGYILTSAGDSLSGWVEYRTAASNQLRCYFRRLPEGPAEVFGPAELKAYGIYNDRIYESRQLPERPEPVFMQMLLRGVVQLYFFEEDFYLWREGRDLVLLEVERQDIDQGNNKKFFRLIKRFAGILRLYCNDCTNPDFQEKIRKADLKEPDLVRVLEAYHQCVGASYQVFKQGKAFVDIQIGLIGGVHATSFEFFSNERFDIYLENLQGEFRPMPMGGIHSRVRFPRLTERFSFIWEALFIHYRYQGLAELAFSGFIEHTDLYVDMQSLKMPLAMQYRLPIRRPNLFINGGVSININLRTQLKQIQEQEFPGGEVLSSSFSRNIKEGFYPGFWAGLSTDLPLGLFVESRLEYEPQKITQNLIPSRGHGVGIQLLAGFRW